MKLSALPVLMNITKITKITGDYNCVRPYLLVDKVMGGVNFCLGLSKEQDFYVPSSALLEDIKNLTIAPAQVLVILEKTVDAALKECGILDKITPKKPMTNNLRFRQIVMIINRAIFS